MISLVIEGLTFESFELRSIFSKFGLKPIQANVGHSVTDEYNVKKEAVFAFKKI